MPEIPFTAIFFDLGNTLIHFESDWTETAIHAQAAIACSLTQHGFQVDETKFSLAFGSAIQKYNQARKIDLLEPTTASVLKQVLREFQITEVNEPLFSELLSDYYAVSEAEWKLPRETLPTLHRLRNMGLQMTLISNAADAANVHRQIKNFHLEPLFDFMLISAEIGIRKPAKEIFEKALDHFKIEARQAVMVGDMLEADILGARNARIPSVWMTRWAHNAENAANIMRIKPTVKIFRLSDLPHRLRHWK